MAFTATQSVDRRAELFGRLVLRNRVIGALRVLVPAIGIFAFLALAGAIYLSSLARQYGVSGIRVDRGNLVVETPQYAGIGSDGSGYVINASEARSPIRHPERIDMSNATLDLTRPGRAAIHAAAAEARVDTSTNHVTVPGITTLHGDDGLHGTLTDVRSDMRAQVTIADGPVDLTFPDGTHLTAANMRFDGAADVWSFDRATLIVPNLPGAESPAIPFATVPWVAR